MTRHQRQRLEDLIGRVCQLRRELRAVQVLDPGAEPEVLALGLALDQLCRARDASVQHATERAPHQRKCHDCGHVDTYRDAVAPECLCRKCGSQDTRRLRTPQPA